MTVSLNWQPIAAIVLMVVGGITLAPSVWRLGKELVTAMRTGQAPPASGTSPGRVHVNPPETPTRAADDPAPEGVVEYLSAIEAVSDEAGPGFWWRSALAGRTLTEVRDAYIAQLVKLEKKNLTSTTEAFSNAVPRKTPEVTDDAP